ncbi:MAG: 30S ribosomal protein S6 [Clostridiales bacterium]|jgi:small subunit ribosomal protein S6|nr:30S ribosomal protein S6 [Clostridiales bacterium]
MNSYEVLYIIDSALDEEAVNATIAKYESLVTGSGGSVEKTEKWGKRKFTYPINHKEEGYYVLMTFTAPSQLPRELERQMRIADEVMRFLVVRK